MSALGGRCGGYGRRAVGLAGAKATVLELGTDDGTAAAMAAGVAAPGTGAPGAAGGELIAALGVAAAPGAAPGAAGESAAGAPAGVMLATSVLSASSSACFVMITMLMRRLIGLCGSVRSNSTEEESPTTRAIFASGRPELTSARRAAFARSAESSQLE
jgi:hypothetical protein